MDNFRSLHLKKPKNNIKISSRSFTLWYGTVYSIYNFHCVDVLLHISHKKRPFFPDLVIFVCVHTKCYLNTIQF